MIGKREIACGNLLEITVHMRDPCENCNTTLKAAELIQLSLLNLMGNFYRQQKVPIFGKKEYAEVETLLLNFSMKFYTQDYEVMLQISFLCPW